MIQKTLLKFIETTFLILIIKDNSKTGQIFCINKDFSENYISEIQAKI